MRTIATGLAALVLAACGSPTGSTFVNGGNGGTPGTGRGTLTFTLAQSNTVQTPQTGTSGANAGSLAFTGSISTASACWTVTAVHARTGAAVTATVTATPSGQTCEQITTFHNYQGTIAGLQAGAYTLTVVHDLGGTAITAFNGSVVVQ